MNFKARSRKSGGTKRRQPEESADREEAAPPRVRACGCGALYFALHARGGAAAQARSQVGGHVGRGPRALPLAGVGGRRSMECTHFSLRAL